jgi:CDP-glucose 4,6-dehydratase
VDLGDVYRGRRVLITGDTGFKGSWLAIWLRELGAQVSGLALPPASARDNFVVCGLADKIDHHDVDVRDGDGVAAAIARARPDVVFHLAARSLVLESYRDPRGTFETNIMGTVNVLEGIRATQGVSAAIIVTSDKCYAPTSDAIAHRESDAMGGRDPYSASKGAAEIVTAAMRASYFAAPGTAAIATVRAGNVIGGGDWAADRIVPDCIRALRAGDEIVVRKPSAVRPWQYVLDALRGYLELGARLAAGERALATSWNMGPQVGSVVAVRELVETLLARWGSGSYRTEVDPAAGVETERLLLDSTKARCELGWEPLVDFAKTIDLTVAGYRVEDASAYAHRVAQIHDIQEMARA